MGKAKLAKARRLAYIASMENIFTYMIYGGAVLAVLGLIGIGLSVRMALKLKKDAPEGQEAKDRMQLLVAINTAAMGTGFIGVTLVAVGVLVS
jgi:nitric oxide reductase large subunit